MALVFVFTILYDRKIMLRNFFVLAMLPLAALCQENWENPVRKLLKEGKPVIAGTVTIASPDVAAQMANMGFDLIWIEMEHSGITLETARNMILATRGLKAMPFIRVPVNELWTAKRALDVGAIGVVSRSHRHRSWRGKRRRRRSIRHRGGADSAPASRHSAGRRPKATRPLPTRTR